MVTINNTLRTRSSNGFTYQTLESFESLLLLAVYRGENRNIRNADPFKFHVLENDIRVIFDSESEARQYFEDKANYGIDSVAFLNQHKPKGGVRDTAEGIAKKQGLGWLGSKSLTQSALANRLRKVTATAQEEAEISAAK